MIESEYFEKFSAEYKEDLKKLNEKKISISDFARKHNMLYKENNSLKVKATVYWDLMIYKKVMEQIS